MDWGIEVIEGSVEINYTTEEIFNGLSDEDKLRYELYLLLFGNVYVDVTDKNKFKFVEPKFVCYEK